ncbi:MAG TPA: hypothetical protein VGN23_03170 [Verrucomicrobiae bacterium]|jgi:hypothetical protein
MSVFASALAEPFTPRGVAAFARVKFGWLFLAQFIIALIAAISLTCFLNDGCYSVIHEAIGNLPDKGAISLGRLHWRGDSPKMLAEGRLLAIDVDLKHSGIIHSTAEVQAEFGEDSIRFYSILPGYSEVFYPEWPAPFNRIDLEPKWNAWATSILFMTAAAAFVSLLFSWVVLATIYFLPVRLIGFLGDRQLNLWTSWKLCAGALLPGALLMIVGIWLYNFGLLNLVSFAAIFAAHFVLGWIYLGVSLFFLPRASATTPKGNPFQPSK